MGLKERDISDVLTVTSFMRQITTQLDHVSAGVRLQQARLQEVGEQSAQQCVQDCSPACSHCETKM